MKTFRSSNQKTYGFTIVELLIVIIVIGILATITTVAYVGVQQSSQNSSASANASVIQRKIEAYLSLAGSYPKATTAAAYTSALNSYTESSISSSNITLGQQPATKSNSIITVSKCTSDSNGAFYRLEYWDFNTKDYATKTIDGSATTATCGGWTRLP